MKPIKLLLAIAVMGLINLTSHAQDCDPPPSGLVSWWAAEGNALDNVGTNNGTLIANASYGPGEVGQAFSFNSAGACVNVPDAPPLDPTNALTLETWMNVTSFNPSGGVALLAKDGVYSGRQFQLGMGLINGSWVFRPFVSVSAGLSLFNGTVSIQTNIWYHVAMTYDGSMLRLFVNGQPDGSLAVSGPLITSTQPLRMGGIGFGSWDFQGRLDEVSLYNRALSSNEIAAIYLAGSAGKCFTLVPPVITSQPTNQTVVPGGTATFSVGASGTAPLSYQWFKDGIVLLNATNSALTLTNVQPPRIGNYTVAITNSSGSVTSSVASLSIANINSGLWQGLVAYYPFNGNANDAEATNNGKIYGGVVLTTDRFGSNNSAYAFNGVDGYIDIGNPVGNSPSNLTEAAWVKIISRATTGTVPEDVIITKRQTPYIGSGWPDLAVESSGPNAGAGEVIVDADNYLAQYLGTSHTQTNVWFFICEVSSNNVYQIYVNGALENTITNSTPLSSVEDMYLMHQGTWGTYCHGVLDDVRIYNRALSSSDVAQLYASEAPTHAATATATLAGGFVVSNSITDGGAGYTNTPTVHFIGGGGSGATAFAVVSNGVVTAINMISAGSGYTNLPLVVIDPPFIPNPVLGIAPASILTFSNLTIGAGYQLQQFQSWYWSNQPVSFTATNATYAQAFSGAPGNGEYRLALAPVPAQAFATPQVVNGFVVGATMTAGGSGYVTPPAVNISGDVGSNATAVAGIGGGAVTNITIINPGTGYTNHVTVQIDPPPAVAIVPTIVPGGWLNSSNLAPYDNYQVQFKSSLAGTWGNWSGGLFSPISTTNSQYIFTTNGSGFFRLQFVP